SPTGTASPCLRQARRRTRSSALSSPAPGSMPTRAHTTSPARTLKPIFPSASESGYPRRKSATFTPHGSPPCTSPPAISASATRYSGFSHTQAMRSQRRRATLQELGSALHVAVTAVGDVHVQDRSRRHVLDVMTAIRLKTTVDKNGRAGLANCERHLLPIPPL